MRPQPPGVPGDERLDLTLVGHPGGDGVLHGVRFPVFHAVAHRRSASKMAAWMLRLVTASPMRKSWYPGPVTGCGCPASRAR